MSQLTITSIYVLQKPQVFASMPALQENTFVLRSQKRVDPIVIVPSTEASTEKNPLETLFEFLPLHLIY